MARVYLARHTGLDRLVAIKVLSKDLDGDQSFSERFMREARIVANLTHQNIITVHDVGVHNEHHYIAMEYLPGETLDDKIKKKLNITQILGITRQIASALDFAHKKGIVHRDVKPDNILFREDGTAVLTDFGIARSAKSETKMTATGTVIGTPHYMSPEQAQGQEIGAWSDLYSLGIVLYEMLSGEVPFDADSTIAVVFKHITEPVPELPETYRQYQSLVNTLLAKEPTERYQSGREVIADIECLQRGESPANATLIFNQTAINPVVDTTTTKIEPTDAPTQASRSSFKKYAAIIAATGVAAAIIYVVSLQPSAPDSKPIADQRALDLAYQKQELEKQRLALEKKTAENTLLEQQRLAQERQQERSQARVIQQREQAARIAQQKQAKAEAEARKARQELLALKKKQQSQSKKTTVKPAAPVPTSSRKTVSSTTSAQTSKPNTAQQPHKTGLLASWLGDVDDNRREYIDDLFIAADNALETGRYASAKQNYERILQEQPANARAKQGLAKANSLSRQKQSGSNDAYIQDLLKAGDNALQSDRLSSASSNYQKVLASLPNNRRAIAGINATVDRYLQLAIDEANDNDFDNAAEYLQAAQKLKPNSPEIRTTRNRIAQLSKR